MKFIDMDIVPAFPVCDWPGHANQLEFLEKERAEVIKRKGFHVVAKDNKNRRFSKFYNHY